MRLEFCPKSFVVICHAMDWEYGIIWMDSLGYILCYFGGAMVI